MQVRSHTLKSARLKERRRKVFIGRIVVTVFCVSVLWGLVFWLSNLPTVTISDIVVSGNISVQSQDIVAEAQKSLTGRYFFTVPKASIFFYPKGAILKDVNDLFPRIASAEIGWKNFHTIEIKVSERVPAALWCETPAPESTMGAGCFYLDSTAFIFAPETISSSTPEAFIKFYGPLSSSTPIGQTYHSADYLKNHMNFANNLSLAGFSVISFTERINGVSETMLSGGQRLIFADDTDLSIALGNFESLVSNPAFKSAGTFAKLDYIDLRFGNKLFYRLK